MKKKITFEVDINKPDEAYAAARKAIHEAINKSPKHKWTRKEIDEAEKVIAELMVKYSRNATKTPLTIYSNSEDKFVGVMYGLEEYKGVPCENDEYNPVIGTCVALCKAFKHPIPNFITANSNYKNKEELTTWDLFALLFE